MDDVYAAAPAHVVFPAVLRFAYRLWEVAGLELQMVKSAFFSSLVD